MNTVLNDPKNLQFTKLVILLNCCWFFSHSLEHVCSFVHKVDSQLLFPGTKNQKTNKTIQIRGSPPL